MGAFDKFSEMNEVITRNVSVISSKKEALGKQAINFLMIFIILFVFGALDFAKLEFRYSAILTPSFWGTILTKTIAGVCSFNIGINMMEDAETKRDEILARAIRKYEILIAEKDRDFEYFVVNVFNIEEKKKAYRSKISKKIYRLNRFSKARDRLLYNSTLDGAEERRNKNRYCIKRKELEELKSEEYINNNIQAINCSYSKVEASIFELEIDGAETFRGIKTKGNTSLGKAKYTSSMVISMVGFSMFFTSFALQIDGQEFENEMIAFWHYCLKIVEDVAMVLWQVIRGMSTARKIVSSELTMPYVGRTKVLTEYIYWKKSNGTMDDERYKSIMKRIQDVDSIAQDEVIEISEEDFKKMNEKKEV